jgi:hypothetical protein
MIMSGDDAGWVMMEELRVMLGDHGASILWMADR